jgi:hypothetical protein
MSKKKSLGEALPAEQARVRELLAEYKAIPQGAFVATLIEQSLKKADEAVISGDVVAMIAAYEDLKGVN